MFNASPQYMPDGLPARVLKHCAEELAIPFLWLAERVLETGRWPTAWCEHWIVPLYKKGATWKPENYPGVHLTAQLGKATERFLLKGLGVHLNSEQCTGANQFAYKKQCGARNALAYLTLT